MRILVIGQGGREHALVWKLAQSPKATKVFCAPGNSGTAEHGQNVPIAEEDIPELKRFCQKEKIDLVVVGPEAPLVAGVADALRQAGVHVFGPSKDAAMLEGSKIFCKKALRQASVPTASAQIFEKMTGVEAYLEAHPEPCVVKADGLAAGKGVVVCDNADAALAAARRMLVDREFGVAGERILIEERLVGQEASVLAITDGETLLTLEPCQDHKRAFDNDLGPNTGGMGAYCPSPKLGPEALAKVEAKILIPTLHALRAMKRPFQGVLYAGLMLTPAGPKTLEFNVRFGDPEAQPLLMRLKTDLVDLLWSATTGTLSEIALEWDPRPAVCVVMASGGYPSAYPKGLPIRGLDAVAGRTDVVVFHAGAKRDDDRVVTAGGRVLGVTALGDDFAAARARAYDAVETIRFTNAMYRRDIAADAIDSSDSSDR